MIGVRFQGAEDSEYSKKLGNQNYPAIISRVTWQMWLGRQFGREGRGALRLRAALVLVALFAFLAARNVSPDFSKTPALRSTITAGSQPNHRLRFDNTDAKLVAPANSFLILPPVAESTHLTQGDLSFSSYQTMGIHFNRPPPALNRFN